MTEQILNRLQKIEDKISKLTDRSKKIDDINKNVEVVYEKQKELCDRFDEAMKDVQGLKKQVSFLEAENVVLKSELKALRASMEDSYTITKQCELEIVGIPPTVNEDIKGMCLKMNGMLTTDLKEKDIIFAQRQAGRGGKVGNILVHLQDKAIRDKIITAARKKKIKCSDIGMTGNNGSIFVNECLSAYSRSVLYQARQFKIVNNWKFCWVRDGKIFLRKAEKEPAVRITCNGDLVILKN